MLVHIQSSLCKWNVMSDNKCDFWLLLTFLVVYFSHSVASLFLTLDFYMKMNISLKQMFLWLLVASFVLAFLFEPCEAKAIKKIRRAKGKLKGNVAKKVGPVKTDLINPDDKIMGKDLTITYLRVGLPALVYALDLVAFSYDMYKQIKKDVLKALLIFGIHLLISLLCFGLPSSLIFSNSEDSKINSYSISSPYTLYVSSLIGMSKYWFEEIFYMSSLFWVSVVFAAITTHLMRNPIPYLNDEKKIVIFVSSFFIGPILLVLARRFASNYYEWFTLFFGILYIGIQFYF
jgi:hypothetical protein